MPVDRRMNSICRNVFSKSFFVSPSRLPVIWPKFLIPPVVPSLMIFVTVSRYLSLDFFLSARVGCWRVILLRSKSELGLAGLGLRLGLPGPWNGPEDFFQQRHPVFFLGLSLRGLTRLSGDNMGDFICGANPPMSSGVTPGWVGNFPCSPLWALISSTVRAFPPSVNF